MPTHWRKRGRLKQPSSTTALGRRAIALLNSGFSFPPVDAGQKKTAPAQGQGEKEDELCRKPTTQPD